MTRPTTTTYTAFADQRRIATGALPEVAVHAYQAQLARPESTLLVFDDATGRVVDVDLRGTPEQVRRSAEEDCQTMPPADEGETAAATRRPGRPKLGVVAREVTLLPRHWDWLSLQPGGVSVTLRRLVEAARKGDGGPDPSRQARDAAYRFMQTMAGDAPGFEEASRALFAGEAQAFEERITGWPADIRAHILYLARRNTPDSPPA